MKRKFLLGFGVCLTALFSNAAILTVNNNNDNGPGSLRAQVAAAAPGDTIQFSTSGTITLTSGEITLNKDLTITAPSLAVINIDGNNTSRIFKVTGGVVVLNSLIFNNGNTSGSGGAVEIVSTVSITFNRCLFQSNHAANDGGAIVINSGRLVVADCTFKSNSCNFDGGGIRTNGGYTMVVRSLFTANNSGYSGAGISMLGGSVLVENTTLSGNTASLNGGGFEGEITFRNCTITNNTAQTGGGGKTYGSYFLNTLIYNNTASGGGPEILGTINSQGNNLIKTTLDVSGFIASDIIGVDPMLGALQDNGGINHTHAIPITSVAINAGSTCCGAPSVDQRDKTRICKPDIGAYENTAANFAANGIDTRSECSPFVWMNGLSYNSNNTTATHTIVGGAANGCDSIVTLNLSIIPAVKSVDTRTACGTFTWVDGITYNTSNSTATHTIVGGAANGCDSIITLNLTIKNVSDLSTSIVNNTVSANLNNASYKWLDCNANYAFIAGETNQTFTPNNAGTYAVQITENGCVDTSNCVVVTNLGIDDLANEVFTTVYPNPTNGDFMIQLNEMKAFVAVKITDLSGKTIQVANFNATEKITLHIDEPAGIYLLHVETENGKRIIKLIKD